MGFLKECSEKKQGVILCQVCDTSYHTRRTQTLGRNFNLVSRTNAICYCHCKCYFFVRNVLPYDFYNSCNSIEITFDDDNHHILINSKHFNINEMNPLKTKENHFGILHLNIASLNEHVDGFSNLSSPIKLNFSIIGLSEHKIGLITLITYPYQIMAFALMTQKSPLEEQARKLCEVTLMFF